MIIMPYSYVHEIFSPPVDYLPLNVRKGSSYVARWLGFWSDPFLFVRKAKVLARPRDYEKKIMLNSAEH